jgi:hypothetical protein
LAVKKGFNIQMKFHNFQYFLHNDQKNITGKNLSWTIGVLGFDSRQGLGIFLFTTVFRTALGSTQPPIHWVPGAPFLGVKEAGA